MNTVTNRDPREFSVTIPATGDDNAIFRTAEGLVVARGYTRVVFGERGPYVEFLPRHMAKQSIRIPQKARWRQDARWRDKVKYVEFRTRDSDPGVKVYFQRRTVSYADYLPGRYYIHPSDLVCDGQPAAIEASRQGSLFEDSESCRPSM